MRNGELDELIALLSAPLDERGTDAWQQQAQRLLSIAQAERQSRVYQPRVYYTLEHKWASGSVMRKGKEVPLYTRTNIGGHTHNAQEMRNRVHSALQRYPASELVLRRGGKPVDVLAFASQQYSEEKE